MIIVLTEVTMLLLSLMKMKSARLFKITPTTPKRVPQSQPLWRGCSDRGLEVSETETFPAIVGTIKIV